MSFHHKDIFVAYRIPLISETPKARRLGFKSRVIAAISGLTLNLACLQVDVCQVLICCLCVTARQMQKQRKSIRTYFLDVAQSIWQRDSLITTQNLNGLLLRQR